MRHGDWDNPVRPDGGKKRKSRRLRASRSPVYLPTTRESQVEAAQWLKRR
jgi:hypothetical protein